MTREKGILYIMSTAVDGLIKVGITDSFEKRMKFLEDNGYYNITGLTRQFAIEVEDYREKELVLKRLFQRIRVGKSELYSLELNHMIQLFSSFEGKQIYPNDESKKEVFDQTTDAVESSELPENEYSLEKMVKGPNGKEQVKGVLKVEKGELILLKGALLSSFSNIQVKGYLLAREVAKKNGRILEENIKCKSASMAAAIVCGTNQNGWTCWKDSKGNFIDIYRQIINKEE